ncbi:major capsid protein [Microbacterium phage Gingerbug]|nr:major capsid protein [Microbacterium phage Gingerbug]
MATTMKADLIVPEVYAPVAVKEAVNAAVMTQVATTDDTLVGQPGDTVTFPKFNRINPAADLSEGVPIVPQKLTTDDMTATIKEVGTAVEVTDTAELTALGNPSSRARTAISEALAEKMDLDLRAAAEDTTGSSPIVLPASTTGLDWTAITAAIAAFGDKWDPSQVAGVVIHSRQHVGLLRDENFKSSLTFGSGQAILRGQVGSLAGNIPVIISDAATKVEGATDEEDTYNALVVRKGALGLLYKRRALIEQDRDIYARITGFAITAHYAVKRLDDKGVVVLPTRAVI